MDNLMTRVQEVFRDVFDDAQLPITETTTARDVAGWDSLANINLIFAIEREFKIKFALGEILELDSAGDMAALIQKKQENAVIQ